jgi:hypothetical protein
LILLSLVSREEGKRRGGSGRDGGWPLRMRVPVGVGCGNLSGSKIFGRPSRARKEGRTGHRWPRGDPEGEAVIRILPQEPACARLFQNHSGHAGPPWDLPCEGADGSVVEVTWDGTARCVTPLNRLFSGLFLLCRRKSTINPRTRKADQTRIPQEKETARQT